MPQKSLEQKLLIREGHRILLLNSPKYYREKLLCSVRKNAVVLNGIKGPADVIQVFVGSKEQLRDQLNQLKPVLDSKSILWVTYPKGTSKVKTDVNRDFIREHAQTIGLEAVSIFSVDPDWSALRLKLV
jgi:hypothetical protein